MVYSPAGLVYPALEYRVVSDHRRHSAELTVLAYRRVGTTTDPVNVLPEDPPIDFVLYRHPYRPPGVGHQAGTWPIIRAKWPVCSSKAALRRRIGLPWVGLRHSLARRPAVWSRRCDATGALLSGAACAESHQGSDVGPQDPARQYAPLQCRGDTRS